MEFKNPLSNSTKKSNKTINENNNQTNAKGKNTTQANKLIRAISNRTKERMEKFNLILKPPFIPRECGQVVIIKAKMLINTNDYSKKTDAFFTLGPLRLNIFEKYDIDSLINSLNMQRLNRELKILKGSLNCLFFHERKYFFHNATICIENREILEQIKKAFLYYKDCIPVNYKKSNVEELETLLNVLNTPDQVEYKLTKFKRALAEDLTQKGVKINLLISNII